MEINNVTDLDMMHTSNASFQQVEARAWRDHRSPREITKLDYLTP